LSTFQSCSMPLLWGHTYTNTHTVVTLNSHVSKMYVQTITLIYIHVCIYIISRLSLSSLFDNLQHSSPILKVSLRYGTVSNIISTLSETKNSNLVWEIRYVKVNFIVDESGWKCWWVREHAIWMTFGWNQTSTIVTTGFF
jgi:hypothetical protein